MSAETGAEDPSEDATKIGDADLGDAGAQYANGGDRGESPEERGRRSDELACRLAYECGWRLCGDALQTLESQRTRAFTLLSVTLVAAGIATASFVRGDEIKNLGCVGILGLVVFALGTLVVMGCAATVAWPLMTEAALRPSHIINHYVTPQNEHRKTTWVYKNLARDMESAYDKMSDKLKVRNMFYKWSLACVPVVVFGAAMLVVDVIV